MYKSQDITERIQQDVKTSNTSVQEEKVESKTTQQTEIGEVQTTDKEKTTVTEKDSSQAKSVKVTQQRKKPPKLDNIIDCLHYGVS